MAGRDEARHLIEKFAELCRGAFGENVIGVYLHGSAAMGCYNPAVSDLDFIVVVREAVSDAVKRAFMDRVLELDTEAPGKGIELSVVLEGVCDPFVFPTPFELHYSRMHTAWYARDPRGYIEKMRGTDVDLAAHFTVIRSRGKRLWGEPIDAVFAPVPQRDYLDSILGDVSGAPEEIAENPMYLTLNLARVLAFLKDGAVLSKREGGEWALRNLPEACHPLLRTALGEYTSGAEAAYDADQARQYARDMLARIREAEDDSDAG